MKNLKKSIMLATALFVTTGAMANQGYNGYKESKQYKHSMCEEGKGHHGYKNNNKKERRSHKGDISRFFIGTVYSLQLTKEQETKVDKIIQEFKKKRFDKFNGFTKNGFDKQKFIEARKNARANKIKLKADLIESIYKVLNQKQIEQLNKEIDIFKTMKINRGKHDSSCNDRR